MTGFVITGARVIFSNDVIETDVWICEGRIAGIGDAPSKIPQIDMSGRVLAPAIIDVHGDAFERQMMPRPGVHIPIDTALLETDRQLASNGIATAYHALTVSWEPGLRSVTQGRAFMDALNRLSPRFLSENRVQFRWETFCSEAVPLLRDSFAHAHHTPSLAFNDHTSMAMVDPGVSLQDRPFEFAPGFPVADLASDVMLQKLVSRAKRAGLTAADYASLLSKIWERRETIPDLISDVATLARAAQAPMLSHDDTQIETRDFYLGHGAQVSEFPMQKHVAAHAKSKGNSVVFGAPNAMRGGSHLGSPAAADMIEAGLCDVLASDYYYPAMLAAIAKLNQDKRGDLHTLWRLVSDGPARAMRLTDRGRIEPGLRADLVAIDWPKDQSPAIVATYRNGQPVFQTRNLG